MAKFLGLNQMPAGSSAEPVKSEDQSRETTRRQLRISTIPKQRATTTETGIPSKSETEDTSVQIRASDSVYNNVSLTNSL